MPGNVKLAMHFGHSNRHKIGDASQAVVQRLRSAYTSIPSEAEAVETLEKMRKRLDRAGEMSS